ncbi:unnamed protein product [Oikopleura dioica]|uniref:Olfactomedin-like domain-containing protein n=1 Tax=Oikopleura dioica TaxID=34765 RepID=E4YEX2_OIKDI|nr:unnamed protein product [Oikopleura dioica]
MQLCVQKITFHILVFDVPLQYFLPSKSIQFEVPEAGFWSEDPITNSIYFIKFDTRTTELYEFDTFTEFREARFNSLKPSVSLTVPALDAKFATWDRNIYYLTSSKMIKFSTAQRSQVDTVDLSEEISSSSDLFNPSLDLMTSESGLFGVIRLGRSDRFRILQFSTEGKLRISDRWEVNLNTSRKNKAEENSTVLIVGDVLYVVKNGKISGAVNFKTTELLDFDANAEFELSGMVSYNPSGSLAISDGKAIGKIELEFSSSPKTTTTTTTTSKTSSTTSSEVLKSTTTISTTTESAPKLVTSDDPKSSYSSTSEFCPAISISSYSFPQTEQLTLVSVPCESTSGSATFWCDRGIWSSDGPDFSECREQLWSEEIETLWQGNNHSLVLQRVQAEVPSLSKLEAAKLVKEVSKVMTSTSQDISASAFSLLEELHCRALLNSEQFLYIAFSSSTVDTLRPHRCGEEIFYKQYENTDRGNLSAGAQCEVLIQEKWRSCVFCDLCPPAIFIKVEEQTPNPLFSAFYIAVLFSTIIVSVLLFVLAISRAENLFYPGILRMLTVMSVLFCDLSLILTPDYGLVTLDTKIFRDTAFSFFVILEFMFLLGISHSLRQRTKPVSSPNFHVERYLCLASVTALILVIGTYVSFIIFGPKGSSGWLHLGWTWTISLILPVLVSSLISLSWFFQSLCVDSPVRIVAAKMVPFLVMTLLSTVIVVVSFGQPLSKAVEWTACPIFMTKTILLVFAFIPSSEDVANPFLWWSRRFGPSNRKEPGTIDSCKNAGLLGGSAEQSWLIADNRTSLAEFRYIPVVHNLTGPNVNYAMSKPRAYLSSERIYSEIGPPENHEHYRPATIQHFRQDSCQTWSEEISNNSNNSQRERKREDSGVHTAQNSSDFRAKFASKDGEN